jgi:hypothetical protein
LESVTSTDDQPSIAFCNPIREVKPSFLPDAGMSGLGGRSGHPQIARRVRILTLSVISPPSIAALRKVYSITSSARTSNDDGTSRPSAFAVLRLITSSNVAGCMTGRSAAFVPFRIRLA